MKKLILLLFVFIGSITLNAQEKPELSENAYIEMARTLLKAEKKEVVAENMMLEDRESGPFWTLYDEYSYESYKLHNKRVMLIKDYAKNYQTLTNEKADELYTKLLTFESNVTDLEKKYYNKFKKIVPAGKAVRLMQIESKIEAMINAKLAEEIPLVEISTVEKK